MSSPSFALKFVPQSSEIAFLPEKRGVNAARQPVGCA
jgi:hypothetical protein